MRQKRRSTLVGFGCLAALAAVAAPLHAQDVTVGTANTFNRFPFQDYASFSYQQVYAASSFSTAVFIRALRFSNTVEGPSNTIDDATYRIRFSTTPAAVGGLSTTVGDNVGPDVQEFFYGALHNAGLRIQGQTPFFYDPSQGNLLMDVALVGSYVHSGSGLDADNTGDATSRVYYNSFFGEYRADNVGLVTTFETATSVAPEPWSVVLLATGLAVLGLVTLSDRKRRSAAAEA